MKKEGIDNIILFKNVCLNKDVKKKVFYNFIVIETNIDHYIYDISNGNNYSNIDDKNIALIQGKTEMICIFKDGKLNSNIKLNNIVSIDYYNSKNNIINNILNRYDNSIIVFKDSNNNASYLSLYPNRIMDDFNEDDGLFDKRVLYREGYKSEFDIDGVGDLKRFENISIRNR